MSNKFKPHKETLTVTAACAVRLSDCLNTFSQVVEYDLPLHYNNRTHRVETGTPEELAAARDGAIARAGRLIQGEGWLVMQGFWACPECRKEVEVKKDKKQSAPGHWQGD